MKGKIIILKPNVICKIWRNCLLSGLDWKLGQFIKPYKFHLDGLHIATYKK